MWHVVDIWWYLIILGIKVTLCVRAVSVIFWLSTVFQHANICVHASKYHKHQLDLQKSRLDKTPAAGMSMEAIYL